MSRTEPTETDGTAETDRVDGAPADTERPETAGEPLLRVEGLSKSFGSLRVLDDVSFTVERGSVVALAGPNGSGKTTLLRAIAGLTPHGGRVDLDAGGPRRVGYLPQSPAFRPGFTVAETLAFYASLLPGDEDPGGALERVGLGAAGDRRVDELSGGMARLLGLAQAALGDPPLLLLDEPTSDLDPRMTAHVFGAVDDLADEGVTVLLATHDPRGVDRSDTALLLADGRIAASGPPESFQEGDRDALSGLFDAAPEAVGAADGEVPSVGAAAREAGAAASDDTAAEEREDENGGERA